MNAGYLSVTCTAYVMNSPLFLISPRAQDKHYIYFPKQVHLLQVPFSDVQEHDGDAL